MFVVKIGLFITIALVFWIPAHCLSNFTSKYLQSDYQTRQSRLISFHTLDEGDIELELEFKVPFLTIPIKRTMNGAHGSLANINVGAIALTGAIVFGAIIAGPTIFALANKKSTLFGTDDTQKTPNSDSKESSARRRFDESQWKFIEMLANFDMSLLEKHDVNITGCMQRLLCDVVENASLHMQSGSPGSMDKIIDGIVTNEWMLSFVKDTFIDAAIKNGLQSKTANSCLQKYLSCNTNLEQILEWIQIAQLIYV